MYALQLSISIRNPSDNNETGFIVGMMDSLETEKNRIAGELDAIDKAQYVLGFAKRLFELADEEDKAGKATKRTARNFYQASLFFDVYTQFTPLDENLLNTQNYAKWRATAITSDIDNGRQPSLPNPNGDGMDIDASYSNISESIMETKPAPSPPEQRSNSPIDLPDIPQTKPLPRETKTEAPKQNVQPKNNIQRSTNQNQVRPVQNRGLQRSAPMYDPLEDTLQKSLPLLRSITNFQPGSPDAIEEAYKYSKYILSALLFEDVETAVHYTKACLNLLNGENFQ